MNTPEKDQAPERAVIHTVTPSRDTAHMFRKWVRRYLADPQVIILGLILVGGLFLILWLGHMLTPVAIAIIIAYLLDGVVDRLGFLKIPRTLRVMIVFVIFVAIVLAVLVIFVPALSAQVGQLIQDLPKMVGKGQKQLLALPERYPDIVSEAQIRSLLAVITTEMTLLGQKVLSYSIASVRSLVTLLVYLVLVPLLVFFFLRDKARILGWLTQFLPAETGLAAVVWHEVNRQVANYVRGKVWEIFIVASVAYATFMLFGLRFALLLAVMVGLSVIVPYIGAAVATLPVALVAYYQWGLAPSFFWIMLAYFIIQFLDGNVLVPLLLSGVVNLHPVAIITAVLVFGGLWGVWGLFFAIPLATLVNALINAGLTHRRG
jgi:putative permease